jgi:hypothetical protein
LLERRRKRGGRRFVVPRPGATINLSSINHQQHVLLVPISSKC